jgi:diaminopimelate decarboxylase
MRGCDTLALAAQFGTPLFVYDEDHLRDRCRQAVDAFGPGVNYATKAFLCRAMARLAVEEGMNLDVSTGGEYHVVRSAGIPAERLVLHGNNKSIDEMRTAGIPAERLVLHGNNKSIDELRTAMADEVGRIVVDSFDEIDRIEQLVNEGLPVPRVLVRITPGVEAHTHEFVQTGQDDSKFGFGVASGAAAAALERLSASPLVELVGMHAHVGSQVFEARFFELAVEVLAQFFTDYDLPELSVGGGLGVAYVEGEEAPTIAQWGAGIRRACDEAGVRAWVTAEPGRSIVASAGVTLYTVGTVKELPGIRTYVSVDGGMSDNPRPVLYDSGYESFLPRAVQADRPRTVRVVGKHCESGDLLVREAKVPADLAVGDILCTPVTGAYGHSMGSNYNKVPRPAVVFVRNGEARLVVRRETFDDLLRCEVE